MAGDGFACSGSSAEAQKTAGKVNVTRVRPKKEELVTA